MLPGKIKALAISGLFILLNELMSIHALKAHIEEFDVVFMSRNMLI